MALIVEDGTGKADAESFISVADATTYHTNRGNSAWTGLASDTIREQHLRKATDYIEEVYRLRWKGQLKTTSQSLAWPRAWVEREDFYVTSSAIPDVNGNFYYPDDEVPTEVKNACAELALRSIDGQLSPDLTQGVKREKVDVLEVEYDTTSPQYTRYRAIDNMLAPLLKSTGGAFRKVMRA
jgi:hypothetical protein